MNKRGTVCFIVDNGRVLLARIRYPDGKLVWNGIGGVMEPGETSAETVVREVAEETKISLKKENIRDVLTIQFPELELHVCTASQWHGMLEIIDPTLTELKWFLFSEVPYTQMHEGNDRWLPLILGSI